MLQFGNKEFRNLQEQVLKNMRDIQDIMEGTTVLADFGIKVVGQVETAEELPDPAEYLEEGGEYGDAFIVGTEEPYEYYIFTRAFEGEEEPQWFDLGVFPQPGPQGEQGIQGETGATPIISNVVNTSTLSPGSFATVYLVKSGTAETPTFTWSFGIPQGAQGIQGPQGIQGQTGPQGEQGVQGEKGDPGYLYTIIGHVNDSAHLPLPTQVRRDSAFLVGTQEPYDVYVIIGESSYELEWINLGEIATVEPMTFVASDTYESSGTLDASTLAAIIASTDIHYLRDGDVYFQKASILNGSAYYTSIGVTGTGTTEVGYLIVDLSDGSWEVEVNIMPTDVSNYVTTNTTQTITADKTMDGAGVKFTDSSNVNPITFKLYLDNYNNLIVDRAGQPSYLFATSQLSGMPGGTKDLGSDQYRWNDLYLKNSIQIKNPSSTGAVSLSADAYNGVSFTCNGYSSFLIAPFTSYARGNFCTTGTTYKDLGSSTYKWGDLYSSGAIKLSNTSSPTAWALQEDTSGNLLVKRSDDSGSTYGTNCWLSSGGNAFLKDTSGAADDYYNLGQPARRWKNLYLSGNISDGTNSIPVTNLIAIASSRMLYKHALLFRDSSNNEFTVYIVSNDSTEYQTDYAMMAGVLKSLAIIEFSQSILASKYLSVIYSTVDNEYQLLYISQTSSSIQTESLGSTFVSDTVTSY